MYFVDPVTGETYDEPAPGRVSMPPVPYLRTRYNYDTNVASNDSGLACTDPTRTQQQFREEVDINTIVRNFGVTGELPQMERIPLNADFYDLTDYQGALHALMQADEAFMTLPSGIRKRFDNDPAAFVAFASDPGNAAEIKAMGLGRPETPRHGPIEVKVVPDPTPDPKTSPSGFGD